MSGHRVIYVAGLVVAVTAGVLITSPWTRASVTPMSRAALASTFDSDMRHVVYEWDPDDPRSEGDRRTALFDFMYETYQASAWIPQSRQPDHSGRGRRRRHDRRRKSRTRALARQQAGPGIRHGAERGFEPAAPMDGELPGLSHGGDRRVVYLGAGTKVFDEVWLGEALKRLTSDRWHGLLPRNSVDSALAADANRILNSHHHDKIDSLTRARSTAFAASHVELYMRPHNGTMPGTDEVGRGDVKTPPLWHTAAKMPVGRWYTDGSFHGPFPLMASSMELEKDRPFDALTEVVVPRIKREFDSVIRHLRPPRYPYAIDGALAARGRVLFDSPEVGCYRCHGVYDGRGHVSWPGVHADVGTDPSRIAVVSAAFIEAFNDSPLAAEGALAKSGGYAATPLTGVWANFPYLHNGSVPTLHHLLGPPSERPRIFQVTAARRFDRARVGQQLWTDPRDEGLGEADRLRRFGYDRNWFNSERPGSANGGHDVWPRIRTDANRRALIEYLKTL